MPIFVLGAGCNQEAVSLLREAAATGGQSPVVYSVADFRRAHMWAGLRRPDLTVIDTGDLSSEALRFLQRFRADPTCTDIPLLAIVDSRRRADRAAVIRAGATDVITAPLDLSECRARVCNLLTLGAQHRQLRDFGRRDPQGGEPLERQREWAREILLRFARARDYRREEVGDRIGRVGRVSRAIAQRLGLPAPECDIIELAAPMHDIGKIGIPDSVLLKSDPYTPEERKLMEQHTLIGYELLRSNASSYLQRGAEIALAHHERYDGSGYPYGLREEGIPIAARIVAVVDVYDALRIDRPYKPSWPTERVIRYLDDQRGKQFDPRCVQALFAELARADVL